jgi:hypothetical protein
MLADESLLIKSTAKDKYSQQHIMEQKTEQHINIYAVEKSVELYFSAGLVQGVVLGKQISEERRKKILSTRTTNLYLRRSALHHR